MYTCINVLYKFPRFDACIQQLYTLYNVCTKFLYSIKRFNGEIGHPVNTHNLTFNYEWGFMKYIYRINITV